MTTQPWLIVGPEDLAALTQINTSEVAVQPRPIDNPAANSAGHGPLAGKYVVPARLLIDPDYSTWVGMCQGFQNRTINSNALFLPDQAMDAVIPGQSQGAGKSSGRGA